MLKLNLFNMNEDKHILLCMKDKKGKLIKGKFEQFFNHKQTKAFILLIRIIAAVAKLD